MSDSTAPTQGRVTRFNLALARKLTIAFGTMWCFYAFAVYGALGAIFPKFQVPLLYWSNWVQMWSLPLLMVGAYVLGRDAEQRDLETHDSVKDTKVTVLEEIGLVRDDHAALAAVVTDLSGLVSELHAFHLGTAAADSGETPTA